ncbi:MAG: hypothetical protein ACTSRZ_03150 [Promethearchaeota archaeon]
MSDKEKSAIYKQAKGKGKNVKLNRNNLENNIKNQDYAENKIYYNCIIALNRSITNELIISAIFQFLFGAIIYLLSILPLLLEYDVLYWPPFLVFSLEKAIQWQVLSYTVITISLLQIIFAVLFRILMKKKFAIKVINIGVEDNISDRNKRLRKFPRIMFILLQIFIIFQLLILPIGTFFGIMELKEKDKMKTFILNLFSSNNVEQEKKLPIDEFKQNDIKISLNKSTQGGYMAKIISISAIIYLCGLIIFYLFTIYLSTLMLDLTYPYLTMGVLLKVRKIIIAFIFIVLGQLFLGLIYFNEKESGLISRDIYFLLYFYAIIQLFIIPIGIYVGVLMLRDLKLAKKFKVI